MAATEVTMRVWRGDAKGGAFVEYRVPSQEGMVVLDVIHTLQATQAGDLACALTHFAGWRNRDVRRGRTSDSACGNREKCEKGDRPDFGRERLLRPAPRQRHAEAHS